MWRDQNPVTGQARITGTPAVGQPITLTFQQNPPAGVMNFVTNYKVIRSVTGTETCASPAVTTSSITVPATATLTLPPFTPAAAGSYFVCVNSVDGSDTWVRSDPFGTAGPISYAGRWRRHGRHRHGHQPRRAPHR